MRVIKLGGSLMTDRASLISCLNSIEQMDKVVVVPGGGVFADQVRSAQQQWQFDDEIAHQMAILAMQQMALLFKGIKHSFVLAGNVLEIQQALLTHSVVIWSPDIHELNASAVQASWDITSDSLAAWLARQLTAKELILVKSAEIPLSLSGQQIQQDIVDPAFDQYTQNSSFKITLINKNSFNEYTSS